MQCQSRVLSTYPVTHCPVPASNTKRPHTHSSPDDYEDKPFLPLHNHAQSQIRIMSPPYCAMVAITGNVYDWP